MRYSNKKLYSIILEAYNSLYNAAIPSVSFDELSALCTLYEDYDGHEVRTDSPLSDDERLQKNYRKKIDFYSYFIPDYKYREIVDEIEKRYKLKAVQQTTFRFHAYLGCGPTSSHKRWLEKHPEYTYKDLQQMCNEKGYTLPDLKNDDEDELQYC